MLKFKSKIFYLLLLLFLIIGCGSQYFDSSREKDISRKKSEIKTKLESLTLEEKIGQLILMPFPGGYLSQNSEEWKDIKEDIQKNNVFGYHIWSGRGVFEIDHYTDKMQESADIPLLFTADYEKGIGAVVQGGVRFPSNMAIAATRNPDLAYKAGKYSAIESKIIGVRQIFAPVVDVNNNPDNPIINIRSFGEKPELVSRMANAYISGMQSQDVSACAKHFPGHGDTKKDSHINLPVIKHDTSRLKKIEFPPFKEAIENNVYSIMSAHIRVPVLNDRVGLPATMSESILTDILRNDWEYKGVVYTDAMSMGGIINNYTQEYSFIKALKAGCDVLVNFQDIPPEDIVTYVKNAIDRGEITEDRIDESVQRVLELKHKLGLFKDNSKQDSIITKTQLNSKKINNLSEEIAEQALTLPIDKKEMVPLSDSLENISIINLFNSSIGSSSPRFNGIMKSYYPQAETYSFGAESEIEIDSLIDNNIDTSSVVILGAFAKYGAYKGKVNLPPEHVKLIKELKKRDIKLAVIAFGNPYILSQFPEIDTYMCTFSWSKVSQKAAAEALLGKTPISGQMPISIPGLVEYGEGIEVSDTSEMVKSKDASSKTIRTLKRGYPHEANVSADSLDNITNILNKGIQDSAYPGGTFLAAKDGIIFIEESFGNFTYKNNSKKVNIETIYDLASLTKVVSTTSAVMALYEEQKLKLDQPVKEVLPKFGQNGKEKVTFRHLLTHTSGLPSWEALWKNTNNPDEMVKKIYKMPLEYETGSKSVYSCLGFIILGEAVEKITGKNLNEFVQEEIFDPLNMEHTFYKPEKEERKYIAPTECSKTRGGVIQGEVHDENAYYLGGISGNAGLFSTVDDLAKFAQMILNGGIYNEKRIFNKETVELFTEKQDIFEGLDRGLGWDFPSGKSSSGHYFSPGSFGHTGFTGTSLWIDPQKDLFGILLTNRVYPSRENRGLYDIRYKIYDELQKSLLDHSLEENPNTYNEN